MKKGRENNQFLPRKFVLSEIDNTIKYYVKVNLKFRLVSKHIARSPPVSMLIFSMKFMIPYSPGQEGPQGGDKDFRHQRSLQPREDPLPELPPDRLPQRRLHQVC